MSQPNIKIEANRKVIDAMIEDAKKVVEQTEDRLKKAYEHLTGVSASKEATQAEKQRSWIMLTDARLDNAEAQQRLQTATTAAVYLALEELQFEIHNLSGIILNPKQTL